MDPVCLSDEEEPTEKDKKISSGSEETCNSTYKVTCKVNIAIALYKEKKEHVEDTKPAKKKKKPLKDESRDVVSAPRAEGYYCIEYNLLPDDAPPTQVDLVFFGLAAKVYMASETKVLKPWREGNYIWVAWSEKKQVTVTKELLIKMAVHKIVVRLWDSKEKVSHKARSDKPKGFRLSQGGQDHFAGIGKKVYKLRASYEKENLKNKDPVVNQDDSSSIDCKKHPEVPDLLTYRSKETPRVTSTRIRSGIQKPVQNQSEVKEVETLELSCAPLLAGNMELTDCFGLGSGGMIEGFWNVTLKQPLLSDLLKAQLNPLIITITSASSLPSALLPKENYLPVYCQYKFPKAPLHKTNAHQRSSKIYFRHVSVVFTGLLSPGKLCQYLKGPPLEIEVHDQDLKPVKVFKEAALFGTKVFDDKLANVTALITRDEFHRHSHPICPHGIAKLDLSDLLLGHKHLKLNLPIRSNVKHNDVTKMHQHPSLRLDHYIEADALLKVQVKITCALDAEGGKNYRDCGFGRIIYRFDGNTSKILDKMKSEIQRINMDALKLNDYPMETVEKFLARHKLSAEDRSLNVLTGFHFVDKASHLFVLEGLKEHGIRRLWTAMPTVLDRDEEEQVTVLYNSDLSFSERLYDTVDLSLSSVCSAPLEVFQMNPKLFLESTVPDVSIEAMKRITRLYQIKNLKEAVRRDLFPSADMVLSLTKIFTPVLEEEDLELSQEAQGNDDALNVCIRKRPLSPLDNFNREYILLKQRQEQVKDFVKANIEDIHKASTELKMTKSPNETRTFYLDQTTYQTGHSKPKERSCIPFIYPGVRSTTESNQHAKRPEDARIEDLRKPWRENLLHANILKSPLSRVRYPWAFRDQDFELFSQPKFQLPTFLEDFLRRNSDHLREEHLPGDPDQDKWKNILEFNCYVKSDHGDKQQDLLKDKPMKYSLKKPNMVLKPIPMISVIRTTEAGREAIIPFAPGPFLNHSLSWDQNTIPRHPSQFDEFHFRSYWRPHTYLHKRKALPLKGEKNDTQLLAESLQTDPLQTSQEHREEDLQIH